MDSETTQATLESHAPLNDDQVRELDAVVEELKGGTGATIRVMSRAQELFGYLPPEVLGRIAGGLGVPPSEIYGIATFYSHFRTSAPARHTVTSCQGTACYVSGGRQVLEEIERILGVPAGSSTPDREFAIQPVRCIGACALAPVILVDGEIYPRVAPTRVRGILAKYSDTINGRR